MKVSVAHVVNGQVAGASDLVSLMAGGQSGSFASLLDLDGTERNATQRVDEGPGKQGHRSKEKDDNDGATPAHGGGDSTTRSNLVGVQTISDIAVMPWQLESDSSGASPDAGKITRATSLTETTNEAALQIRTGPAEANVQSFGASGLNLQQIPNKSTSNVTSFQNLGDESPKGEIRSQDIDVAKVAPSPNDTGMPSKDLEPSSVTPANAGSSKCSVDSTVSTVVAETYSGPTIPELSPQVGYAVSSHEVKPGAGRENPTTGLGAQSSDSSPKNNAQATLSAHSQSGDDLASPSPTVADNRSQDNASDPHRGAPDGRQPLNDARFPAPQKLQGDALGVANPSIMLHGHSAAMNSNHAESVRESTPNTQFREPPSARAADEGVARLLGSAMRGDLRVGLQTEAFGHVTIQANTQGGQLSAQLSLENAKESATLAAHLPGVEHKIIQEHGLTASVRLVGGFGGTGAGSTGHERSGSGRRDPAPYIVAPSMQIKHNSLNENREADTVSIGSRHFVSSRLDVTV